MDGVRATSSRGKWYSAQDGCCSVDLFLNDQAGPIDIGFVPVIAVCPAKHVPKVAAAKGTDRARRIDFSVRSRRSQDCTITAASSVGDESGVRRDGENLLTVSIATPTLAI